MSLNKNLVIFDMYGVFLLRNFWLREYVNADMVALLKELKAQGVRVVLLSNIFVRDSAYFKKRYEFLSRFDACYFSSDLGFSKPQPEAYQHVLLAEGVAPGDAVFYDDREVNVAAAQALGIEAHVFTNASAVFRAFGLVKGQDVPPLQK